jgi:hypothetical protein
MSFDAVSLRGKFISVKPRSLSFVPLEHRGLACPE